MIIRRRFPRRLTELVKTEHLGYTLAYLVSLESWVCLQDLYSGMSSIGLGLG